MTFIGDKANASVDRLIASEAVSVLRFHASTTQEYNQFKANINIGAYRRGLIVSAKSRPSVGPKIDRPGMGAAEVVIAAVREEIAVSEMVYLRVTPFN